MVAVAFAVAAIARPPRAYLDTGARRVPLTVSSWCWAARCGAPIARARGTASAATGATLRIELAFAPTEVRLAIGGTRVRTSVRGDVVEWRATRGGGLSMTATGVRGFVTYVGRLSLR